MYFKEIKQVIKELNTNEELGLTSEEIKLRIEKYGQNKLKEGAQKSFLKLFAEQFKSILIVILIVASAISIIMGEYTDGIVILIILLINALIGAKQEKSAGDAVKALRDMSSPNAKVVRDGNILEVESVNLVPGDLVVLDAGNYIPADLRLIETINFQVEESALTGESVPVDKDALNVLKEDTPLSERANMAYMGTVATYGRARGIVIGTAMDTEMGHIAKMLDVEEEQTPLQGKLEKLGKTLGIACIAVCVAVFGLGIVRGMDVMEIFMTSISLAVAAVPEGLPAIVTVVLAIGMQRMVKRNVLTKNLSSVETLGSTTVICSDKTGTLTQNKMNVKKVYDCSDEIDVTGNGYSAEGKIGTDYDTQKIRKLLLAAVLCNDSERTSDGKGIIGDPTEGALIVLGEKAGYDKNKLKKEYPRLKEYPFDSNRKMMSTLYNIDGKYIMLTKGAPDSVIPISTKIDINGKQEDMKSYANKIIEVNNKWAENALRVLAYGYKIFDNPNVDLKKEEKNLIFSGLTGMIDPPREEVKGSINECKTAGIRVVMITGDNAITASAIGKQIGLLDGEAEAVTGSQINEMTDAEFQDKVKTVNVFSRVSPEHKVRIVDALKNNGDIVAMTGDGVNDAPSLKKADIGIAMGITGTDVSKEAADMILTDDNFVSIVGAVEEGRVIFSNIRKFVGFLVSCNIGEIIVIFVSMLLGWGVPLRPIQLLFVNLVTDSLPAFALGMEMKENNIMSQKPRDPKEHIINKQMKISILFQSIALAVGTLISYRIGYNINPAYAGTFAFITLISGELLRAYSGRSEHQFIFKIGIFKNKYMNMAVAASFALMALLFAVPFLKNTFELELIGFAGYVIAIALSILPFAAGELSKLMK